jgi:signal transduction histidine kinase/ligand-binding sensor domain-containing protein
MRARTFVVWLCVPLLLLTARPAFAELDNLLRGYSLTSWVEGDGHPLGSVYAMAQDRDGYLWIGSDAGLFRFDGSSFTPWNTLSRAPLPAVAVRAVYVTRRGTLLVGLADGAGVREVRGGALQDLSYTGLPNDDVTELVEDHDGVIWSVSGRVLHRLRDRAWQTVDLPWPVRPGLVLQPYVSRSGDLWVGTRWGVFRRSAKADTFERVSDQYVWGLTEDDRGAIWATDIVGGYRPLGARETPRHELEGAGYRLMHDRRGSLWVATFGKGLWRVHDSQSAAPPIVEVANRRTGLSSDSVQSIFEDRDGNIWVGTTGGLHRLKVRTLTPIEDVGFVVATEPAEGTDVWAGTTNGVIRFSGAPGSWTRVGDGSRAPDVRSLYRDAAGTLWVGASEGLWQLENGRLTQVALPALRQMVVMSIAPHDRSGLWIGDGEWLFHWDGTRLQPFEVPPALPDLRRITFARADRRGRIWLGFSGGRIGFLDHDLPLTLVDASKDATEVHRAIHTMLDDGRGTIWFGGTAGLSRFQDGRLETLGPAAGLPPGDVRAIVEDLAGRLWLSVDRGLLRVERNELTRAFADRSHRIHYRSYDTQDGLAGAPVGIIGSTRSGDGTLWFVRGGGVTTVDPRHLQSSLDHTPPALRIESVVANDRPSTPESLTSFPAGTTRIEIRYTALTLSLSDRIRFRYRLDNVDTTWIDAGTRRTVFYTNLSPGTYRFQVDVDSSGEDDVAGIQPATWSFTIQPAFYQTPAFHATALLAALLSIWGIWRGRLHLMRRRFSLALAERARLSREIHDTLLQSLVGVTLQFDAIANALGPSSAAAREQLIRIRREVEAYIRDARQSISDLRSPLLEAGDLMTVLKDFGKRTVGTSAVRFVTSVTGTPRQYTPKVENQLLRIGQEAIINAVRHASPSRIHLEVRFETQAVTLRVSDDGHGFDRSSSDLESERHYGLTTMRERAEEIGGRFRVVSSAEAGTVVEAIVPTPAASHWVGQKG